MRLLLICLCLLGVGGCSASGSLGYLVPPTVEQGPLASVSGVTVVDKRDEKPNRVATIRGGYGNPLKVLDTTTPVATEVAAVFTRALQTRGMLASSGPYRFLVTLDTLYGDQFMGRRAEIKIEMIVLDQANRPIYSDSVSDGSYEFTFFDNGIFAGIEDLRKTVEKLLSNSIDRMLDKKRLFDALSAPAPTAIRAPVS